MVVLLIDRSVISSSALFISFKLVLILHNYVLSASLICSSSVLILFFDFSLVAFIVNNDGSNVVLSSICPLKIKYGSF